MSGNKIDVQAGGKWAKFDDGSGMVHRQADGRVRLLWKYGIDAIISETSISGKLFDLPTPDALAQLREWGYVVTGDELVTQTITPSGMVIETRYVFPGEFRIDPPITEARVREIVAQMLAAQPTPAEVREAAKVVGDPNTKWHNITTKIVDPKEAVAPEPTAEELLGELHDAIGGVMNEGMFVPSATLNKLNLVLVRLNTALAAAREYLKEGK